MAIRILSDEQRSRYRYGEEGAKRKVLAARRVALKALATQTFPSLRASL